MSMIQRRRRSVKRTWWVYLAIAYARKEEGDSMLAFGWETLPIMFVATVFAVLTGRQWHRATEYAIHI